MIMMKLMIASMGAEVNKIRANEENQFRLSQAKLIADMEVAKFGTPFLLSSSPLLHFLAKFGAPNNDFFFSFTFFF